MFKVRDDQIEILAAPRLEILYRELLDHARRDFPEETEGLNDERILAHMRLVVKRARKYGIKAERDVYKYVNLSILYGPYFDRNEETAWTREYLVDEDVSDPHQRMNRLYEEAISRLEESEGGSS